MITKLSIVIPAYNEMENFQAGCLQQVANYLEQKHLDWEVIVVDDGSDDGSSQKIKEWVKQKHQWRFIQNSHHGKVAAVKTGVLAASKPYTLFTDFDQATPISEIEKLLPFVKKGYQIVIGSRELKGSLRQQEPWLRHLMGKIFNLMVKIVAVRGIEDTQCGFKLFKTTDAKKLFKNLKVYRLKKEKYAFTGAFDVELLYIATKWGLKIAEVPIHWKYVPTQRVNPLRDSLKMFFHILKVRLTDILGGYKKI